MHGARNRIFFCVIIFSFFVLYSPRVINGAVLEINNATDYTYITYSSDRTPQSLYNIPTFSNLSFNSTLTYNIASPAAYFELPFRTKSVKVRFSNHNCIFPVVCILRNDYSYQIYSQYSSVLKCHATAFDGLLISEPNNSINQEAKFKHLFLSTIRRRRSVL
jgi:hypothetical protein